MADPILKPVSGLAPAATLTGAELVPLVQGGVSKRATAQDIANLAAAGTTVSGPAFVPVINTADVRWIINSRGALSSTVSMVANQMMFFPVVLSADMSFSVIGTKVGTGIAGSVYVGVYADSVAAGLHAPGDLIATSGALSTAVAGWVSASVSPIVLAHSTLYWLAIVASGTQSLATVQEGSFDLILGHSNASAKRNGIKTTQAGPMPANMSSATYTYIESLSSLPVIFFGP